MKENKTTCPMCFSKMQKSDHSLICPECGYRYCDHSYDNRDLYSTDHTHTPQYTTASVKTTYQPQNRNVQPTQPYPAQPAQPRPVQPVQSAAANRPNTVSQDQLKQAKSAGKIIRTIFIIYFIIMFLSMFLPAMLRDFF